MIFFAEILVTLSLHKRTHVSVGMIVEIGAYLASERRKTIVMLLTCCWRVIVYIVLLQCTMSFCNTIVFCSTVHILKDSLRNPKPLHGPLNWLRPVSLAPLAVKTTGLCQTIELATTPCLFSPTLVSSSHWKRVYVSLEGVLVLYTAVFRLTGGSICNIVPVTSAE